MKESALSYLQGIDVNVESESHANLVKVASDASERVLDLCKGNRSLALDTMLEFLKEKRELNDHDVRTIKRAYVLSASMERSKDSGKQLSQIVKLSDEAKASGELSDNGEVIVAAMIGKPVGSALLLIGLGVFIVGVAVNSPGALLGAVAMVVGGICYKGGEHDEEGGDGESGDSE